MARPDRPAQSALLLHPRMARELRTVQAMIRIYCRAHHGALPGLCDSCRDLADYAEKRLAGCPFQERKSTCGKCPVHCYKPALRARIVEVMRFSGPRMMLRHPFLACAHILDERRVPDPARNQQSPRNNTDHRP